MPLARAEAGDAIVLPLSPFAPPAKHGLCSPNSKTVSQPSPKLAVDRHAVELALLRAWGQYVDKLISHVTHCLQFEIDVSLPLAEL